MRSLGQGSLQGLGLATRGSATDLVRQLSKCSPLISTRRCRSGPLPQQRTVPAASLQLDSPSARARSKVAAPPPPPAVWNSPSGQPEANGLYRRPLSGRPEPFGASIDASSGALNFAVMSSASHAVSLVLFTESDLKAGRTTHELPLDPVTNKTGDVWHVMLPGLRGDLLYGYRVAGPHQDADDKAAGHRHDQTAVVLDPYAKAVLSRRQYGQLANGPRYGSEGVLGLAPTWPQAAGALPRHDNDTFDWQGDKPLNTPMHELVLYEMHVRGFTQHSSSGVRYPGTYAGMVEKLDHLQKLGVNAVELLPVHEFNELEYYTQIPGSNTYRYNFWGYSTAAFFAPMSRYSAAVAAGDGPAAVIREFKMLVRECHKRGIEVILDVVFNHTAEGNDKGPTISFRGLDNRVYYMLAPGGEYYNYSGCGNTLNCNQPVVRQLILDCLRYWVTEFHVDGFRFDLASILTRAHSAWQPDIQDEASEIVPAAVIMDGSFDEQWPAKVARPEPAAVIMTDSAGVITGTPLSEPPLIESISEDPILRNTKMIAEAWDCDGLNQVGAFPHYGGRWAEWNGTFRDTVRQFIKGTDGPWAGNFASAICGSPNIYANEVPGESDWWGNNGGRQWRGGRGPSTSVNFVTAHDGFTLADVVSYNVKHNEANGEDNRDGETHNLTWNCGEEGPSNNPAVLRLRQRQQRNIACALMLAHGVPMIHMGDEYGHSKGGNNNTYCHDGPMNYMQWDAAAADATGFARFYRRLINFRRAHPELQRDSYVNDQNIAWHGELPGTPDWTDASRLVAYTLKDYMGGGLYVAFNTAHVPKLLKLPAWGGRVWEPIVDTSKLAPYDFLVADEFLSQAQIDATRAQTTMWAGEATYPILPWTCVIMQSVTDNTLQVVRHDAAFEGSSAAARNRPAAASGAAAVIARGSSGGGWAAAVSQADLDEAEREAARLEAENEAIRRKLRAAGKM